MNLKALKTLEFDKITQQLAGLADSPPARLVCESLKPHTQFLETQNALNETECGVNLIFKKGAPRFNLNRDLADTLNILSNNGTLGIGGLLELSESLECAAKIKFYGIKKEGSDEDGNALDAYFDGLSPLPTLLNEIRRCIKSEDEIADDASPDLRDIRRQMKLAREKIRSELNAMVSGSLKTYLQDSVITIRYERYCLPVKAECKAFVPGMIHDQSASGSTVFVEPQAVVNLNNKIRELHSLEKREIEIILENLSAMAAGSSEPISDNFINLTHLDFVFAKAKLALDLNCQRPVYGKKKIIEIYGARHPLIPADKCVPVDIILGQNYDLLIITGPNTGGKTVSLKTLGLISLMGQAGLFIPAKDRSRLAYFKEIFADIGDEQSIEQSLSTFSSHMTKIIEILKKATPQTLCLFDEIGAGTDPIEGAALAISILSHLHERGIFTMATTHYSELKLFALETPGVENASCEFDIESLAPTYKLITGIPGKSNAFAISEKLGLPKEFIKRAGDLIGKKDKNFEDVIADLEINRLNLEKERAEANDYKQRIKKLEEQLKNKRDSLELRRDRIIAEAKKEAATMLGDAKKTVDRAILEFNKGLCNMGIREMEAKRHDLREKIKSLDAYGRDPLFENADMKNAEKIEIKKGDWVETLDSGLVGVAISPPDDKGFFMIRCGIIESRTNVKNIRMANDEGVKKPKPKSAKKTSDGNDPIARSAAISSEINLIGMNIEDALYALDDYLDDAYLSHIGSVRIVHGKGTGALRLAVANHLKKVKYVSSFRAGEFGEGDSGVTIAEIGE